MRFNGNWERCADGLRRPVVEGGVFGPDGGSRTFPFLIDTGADRTVLSYKAVSYLGKEVEFENAVLEGIGGEVRTVVVDTALWFLNTAGTLTRLNGPLHGRADPASDDLCILGNDLLAHFAVIIDRPGNVVCLLHGRHDYVIQER